jgi:hypothetical protein
MRRVSLVPQSFASSPAGAAVSGYAGVVDAGVTLGGGLGGITLATVSLADVVGVVSVYFHDAGDLPAGATIVSVQLALTHQTFDGGSVGLGVFFASHGLSAAIALIGVSGDVSFPALTVTTSAEMPINPTSSAPWTRADLFASAPTVGFLGFGLWTLDANLIGASSPTSYVLEAIALIVKYTVPAPRLRADDLVQLQKTVNAVATGALTTNAPGTPVGSSVRLGLQPSTFALNGLIDDAPFGSGTFDPTAALFAGRVLTTLERYEGKPGQRAFDLTLTDHVYELNKRRPFGTWVTVSVTTIALSLLADFAPGFTGVHVQAGLPAVSIVFDGSQDFTTCLTTLAQLIDADQYIDGLRDLHLPASTTSAPPDDLVIGSPTLLDDPPISWTTDLSQIRTRVFGKDTSAPSKAVQAGGAGDTTLQVAQSPIFDPDGGLVITGGQRLTYAQSTIIVPGSGLIATTHNEVDGGVRGPVAYATTFVIGGVETVLSAPSASTYNHQVNPPGIGNPFGNAPGGGAVPNANLAWAITFITATGETFGGSGGNTFGSSTSTGAFGFANLPISNDPRVLGRRIYRTKAGALSGPFYLVVTINDNTTTAFVDRLADSALGAVNYNVRLYINTTGSEVLLSNLPIGPAGTTARKIYRTKTGGDIASGLSLPYPATINVSPTFDPSTFYALVTISDNVTTTYTDVADSSGSSGTAPVLTGVVVLTGIPPSGPGAITSPIAVGDVVNLWGQRDDLSAQVALGQLELDDAGDPTEGLHEYTIPAGAYPTAALLNQRLDAELVLFSRPIVAVTFDSLDPKIQVGVNVHGDINPTFGGGWFNPAFFGAWFDPVTVTSGLYGDFLIQTDTISQVAIAANTAPRHHVVASSSRFTLNDLLRRVLVAG